MWILEIVLTIDAIVLRCIAAVDSENGKRYSGLESSQQCSMVMSDTYDVVYIWECYRLKIRNRLGFDQTSKTNFSLSIEFRASWLLITSEIVHFKRSHYNS